MKRLFVFLVLMLAWPLRAVDRPLFLFSECTNRFDLPSGAEAIWLAGQVIRVEAGGGKFAGLIPKLHGVLPARHLVNGKWSSIYPVYCLYGGKGVAEIPVAGTSNLNWRTIQGEVAQGKAMIPLNIENKVRWQIDVVANRLGSQLDPVIRVLDPKGSEVAFADDSLAGGRDPFVTFTAKVKGVYNIEVRDVANASGPNYFFVLRAIWPDLSTAALLWLPSEKPDSEYEPSTFQNSYGDVPIKVGSKIRGAFLKAGKQDSYLIRAKEKEQLVIEAETRRFGSPCDAGLVLMDEKGKVVAESVGVGADGPSITNRFEKAGNYRLRVREVAKQTGMEYWLMVREKGSGVVLSTEAERVEFADNTAKLKISCERHDFSGPVKFRVEGLPEGVSVEGEVPEKKNEGELRLKRSAKGESFIVRISGEAEGKQFPVSTMPALRKLYPLQIFPNAAMDGWIAVNP